MKIMDMPRIERPREKLIKYGAGKLTDTELLAVILGSGSKGHGVMELAGKIRDQLKQGQDVVKDDWLKIKGLGRAKRCVIRACLELGSRLNRPALPSFILSPESVWDQLKDIRGKRKEYFVCFFLDVRSRVLKREVVSIGILNASLVHPREVFEPAIRLTAARVLLAHNHPSGDPQPSGEDIELTARLVKAGELLGIEVVDHVVVSDAGFVSMKTQRMM